jgi:hypothetical protein
MLNSLAAVHPFLTCYDNVLTALTEFKKRDPETREIASEDLIRGMTFGIKNACKSSSVIEKKKLIVRDKKTVEFWERGDSDFLALLRMDPDSVRPKMYTPSFEEFCAIAQKERVGYGDTTENGASISFGLCYTGTHSQVLNWGGDVWFGYRQSPQSELEWFQP